MCIATQHTQILVPGDACNLHDIEAFLEEPGCRLMAQVVEAKILDTGPTHCADIGALDGLSGEAGKDLTVQTAGQGAQYMDGGGGQRHGPRLAVLGIRKVGGAAVQVDVLPALTLNKIDPLLLTKTDPPKLQLLTT